MGAAADLGVARGSRGPARADAGEAPAAVVASMRRAARRGSKDYHDGTMLARMGGGSGRSDAALGCCIGGASGVHFGTDGNHIGGAGGIFLREREGGNGAHGREEGLGSLLLTKALRAR